MPYTCSLDVVDEHGELVAVEATIVAWIMGITRRQVTADMLRAWRAAREARASRGLLDTGDDEGCDTPEITGALADGTGATPAKKPGS